MYFHFVLIIAIYLILQIIVINSFSKLNLLNRSNPLANEVIHDFIYSKNQGVSKGKVLDIWGIINPLNVSLGMYELSVKNTTHGASTLRKTLGKGSNLIVLLQLGFNIKFHSKTSVDGESFDLYHLHTVTDYMPLAFEKLQFGKLTNYHIYLSIN